MIWIRILFVCFIWYNSPFLFANFSNNLVDNFLISIVFFALIIFKLTYIYVLDNLNIIDISNQLWVFSFNEFFYKNIFWILSNGNLYTCVITNDNFIFIALYKMFIQQQLLLFSLIFIFFSKVLFNSNNLENLNFNKIMLHFYILIRYFTLLSFFSLKFFFLQNILKFYKILSVFFISIITYTIFIDKFIFLWKPLFKRWSYIGFYYKTKMFWLFKNRQK